jgi:hypothetical protein
MRHTRKFALGLAVAAAVLGLLVGLPGLSPAAAASDSLSTGFAGTLFTYGMMFDVTTTETITITGLDVHVQTGTRNVSAYYKVGTYDGFEADSGAWTQFGSGDVTGAGMGNPTAFDVTDLTIPAGQTYGLYVHVSTRAHYHDPNAACSASNAQLSINSGQWLNGLFVFSSGDDADCWNGTIDYDYSTATPSDGPADDGDGASADTAPPPGPDMVPIPAGSVVGTFVAGTDLYWLPNMDTATGKEMAAGQSLWVSGLDESGMFYQVLLSGQWFWAPVETLGPTYDDVWNGTPLPTQVVE